MLSERQLERIAEMRNACLCGKGHMVAFKKNGNEIKAVMSLYCELLRIDSLLRGFEKE